METLGAKAALMASVLLCAHAPCRADPYDATASELAGMAAAAARHRVAVLPFLSIAVPDPHGGQALAERLTARLSSQGGMIVVERTLLQRVLSEQGLELHGLINARQAHQVGRILGVDSIVTGTFFPLSAGKLEVHTRLIDTETARILGALTMRVDKDWQGASSMFDSDFDVTPPDFGFDVPPPDLLALGSPAAAAPPELKDALAAGKGCSDWQTRLDELQSGSLELYARRWAAKLRDPSLEASQLAGRPGSEIRSASLRKDFFKRVRALYGAGYRKELSPPEVSLLDASEREAARLRKRCGTARP
ncbi:MAG TPA: hypothetical protein DCM05_07235 [Elusimicrobia bacterium]|nr:hypothetical protein [Elusimicrobiota bacterium]